MEEGGGNLWERAKNVSFILQTCVTLTWFFFPRGDFFPSHPREKAPNFCHKKAFWRWCRCVYLNYALLCVVTAFDKGSHAGFRILVHTHCSPYHHPLERTSSLSLSFTQQFPHCFHYGLGLGGIRRRITTNKTRFVSKIVLQGDQKELSLMVSWKDGLFKTLRLLYTEGLETFMSPCSYE